VVVDLAPGGEPVVPSDGDLSVTVLDRADDPSWSSARHAGVAVARPRSSPSSRITSTSSRAGRRRWSRRTALVRTPLRPATRSRTGGTAAGPSDALRRMRPLGRSGARRAVVRAPGNNVSYRRDALLGAPGRRGSLAVDVTLHRRPPWTRRVRHRPRCGRAARRLPSAHGHAAREPL
jgi:hypothetical protein